jgi:signal transduction histidine kinase
VTSGRQALQAVQHDPPDLILLDITMPEMDGFEVCQRLQEMERSKDVPVIFLTALTDTADKVRAFDSGGVDYVTKPFQFAEVLARVRTHIALGRAQMALTDNYERLLDLEQLRDDLVHMIVHDMRSPLLALQLNLDFLKGSAAALSAVSRQELQAAVESAQTLSRMADELLDVSRLEEGRMPIERAAWDLTQMAREVRSALQTLDRERPIDVESAGPVYVTCDGALVRRVLENLVSNGIRHTPPGGRMRISIASRDSRVRIAVHDEGPSVPSEAGKNLREVRDRRGTYNELHSAGLGLVLQARHRSAQRRNHGVSASRHFSFGCPRLSRSLPRDRRRVGAGSVPQRDHRPHPRRGQAPGRFRHSP